MTAGVLRDVTCGASDETHGTLPWKLTIHYRAYGARGGGGGGGGGGEDDGGLASAAARDFVANFGRKSNAGKEEPGRGRGNERAAASNGRDASTAPPRGPASGDDALKAAAADAFAKTSKHLSAELAIVAAEFRLSADAHDEASRKFDAIASTAEDLRAFAGRLSEKSEKLSPLLRSLRGVDAQVTALEEVAAAMATRASELEAKLVALGGSIAPE